MTNTEIIKGLETFAQWNKGNGGPQLSREKLGEVIAGAIAALSPEPAKEHLPEPPVVAEPPKPKAKK